MGQWSGSWLSGPAAAVRPVSRLGRPAAGPGSVASTATRLGAFALDAVACGLVARLVDPIRDPATAGRTAGLAPLVVFALVYVVGLVARGQTPAMWLLRLRVVPLAGGGPRVGPLAAVVRTALLLLLVPALISDRDGRGLHDKAAGTVVVRR